MEPAGLVATSREGAQRVSEPVVGEGAREARDPSVSEGQGPTCFCCFACLRCFVTLSGVSNHGSGQRARTGAECAMRDRTLYGSEAHSHVCLSAHWFSQDELPVARFARRHVACVARVRSCLCCRFARAPCRVFWPDLQHVHVSRIVVRACMWA